jgi:heat shock protein HslJ
MTAAQPAAEPYRVIGAEVRWSLTITANRMRYEPGEGAPIDVPAPRPRVSETGARDYRAGRLEVSVYPGTACTHRADRRRYADTVWLHIDGRELKGCGGPALAANNLTDTSWQFVEIAGAAVTPTMSAYSLDVASDMVLGYSHCNRFSASYVREGETFRFSWLGSTMSRCPPPHDAHDLVLRRFFSGRAGPVRMSLPDAETLLLSADVTVRLRRVPERD